MEQQIKLNHPLRSINGDAKISGEVASLGELKNEEKQSD